MFGVRGRARHGPVHVEDAGRESEKEADDHHPRGAEPPIDRVSGPRPEHQRDDYHAWLYDENPFRPQGMPAHYALAEWVRPAPDGVFALEVGGQSYPIAPR